MAVDGTWNLTMQTPMGERRAALVATSQGGTLTGKQSTGAVDGDKMSGKMSAGALGSWPFSGVRA